MSEAARNRGYSDRYAGRALDANPYKREREARYWITGWEQADGEITQADFTDPRNAFSLLNPKYQVRI